MEVLTSHSAGTDAAVNDPNRFLLALSILAQVAPELRRQLDELWLECRPQFERDVLPFLADPSPSAALDFETRLAERVRDLGRRVVERVYNRLEEEAAEAPARLRLGGVDYRRLAKTPRRHVATLLGTIALWRHGYRASHRKSAEPVVFPLERTLGLIRGATPALAEAAARYFAEGGATQRAALDRLKCQHGVGLGAERLRALAAEVAAAMAGIRKDVRVERLLALLRQADVSRGSTRPVLSVGRDGITLREYRHRFFECAGVGTASVYDRAGKRLGTVYLAHTPEPLQPAMTRQLTELIEGVLAAWDGPMPRLAYVTDCGDNEVSFYRDVLRPMRHPRTGEELRWQRVVDFYHASERLWAMAAALFGADGRAAAAWAKRMAKLLQKQNGPFRVLHAAARLRKERKLPKGREKEYRKAYEYIRKRTRFMRYAEYARVKIPLGSGVTEAACKTVVTQRLKLSGMRWTKAGAQVVLDLRAMLLSGIWPKAYRRILDAESATKLANPERVTPTELQNAA